MQKKELPLVALFPQEKISLAIVFINKISCNNKYHHYFQKKAWFHFRKSLL